MVVILENNATEEQIKNVKQHLEDFGFEIHESSGVQKTILGAIGVKPGFCFSGLFLQCLASGSI